MNQFRLHCFAQSGNAYKPALMLALCQADWQPVFVDFFNRGNRSAAYLTLNPMGEVPVLEHAGLTLSQSGVILDYLAEQLQQFGARDPAERREIWRWLLFDNHKLTGQIATLRYLRNFTDQGENQVTAFLEARTIAAIKTLNRHLDQQSFVLGDRPTIADLSLCGYLYYENELGFELDQFEAVTTWLARIRALPGWQHPYDLMPGHPLPK